MGIMCAVNSEHTGNIVLEKRKTNVIYDSPNSNIWMHRVRIEVV